MYSAHRAAFPALLAGVACLSCTGVLVRSSDLAPATTAFWRVALAALFLMALQWCRHTLSPPTHRIRPRPTRSERAYLIWAGVLFAGFLALWHWSLALTTVASATLLLHLSPLYVVIFEWVVRSRRPIGRFSAGLAVALTGLVLFQAGDLPFGGWPILGAVAGVLAGMCHGGYFIVLNRLGPGQSPLRTMAWTSGSAAPVLLLVVLMGDAPLLFTTARDWTIVLVLAGLGQIGGQGLVSFAAARIDAAPVALVSALAVPLAALWAWQLLDEPLGPERLVAIALVLGGVLLARHGRELGPRQESIVGVQPDGGSTRPG